MGQPVHKSFHASATDIVRTDVEKFAISLEFVDVAVVLRARDRMILPEPMRGTILRGAFSLAFRRLVCVDPTLRLDCNACSLKGVCPWPAVFCAAPPSGTTRLRLVSDLPRPFVVKPELGGASNRRPGEVFSFRLVLAGSACGHLPYFVIALRNLGKEGIGPGRGHFEVVRVASGPTVVYEEGDAGVMTPAPETVDLRPGPPAEGVLSLEFVTPTAIKQDGLVLRHPSFGALVRRIRDRVNALSTFFGGGPLDLDFAEVGRRADTVRVIENRTRWYELRRRSSRTGQSHELSGLVGRAVFEGPVGEFLPLLHAAELLHVGRHAAFGNGWIRVE
jgi:hypothetical protein